MYGPHHQYLQNLQEEIQGSIMWKEIFFLIPTCTCCSKSQCYLAFNPNPKYIYTPYLKCYRLHTHRKVFCLGTAAVDGSVEICCLWEQGGRPLQKKSENQSCFYKVFLQENDFLFSWKVQNINKSPMWCENMGVFKLHLLKGYLRPWKPAAGFCFLK